MGVGFRFLFVASSRLCVRIVHAKIYIVIGCGMQPADFTGDGRAANLQ
jgi:hypothetical protein